ncbi:MAG: DAK2 domain-containing protein, partial [Acidimicrobiales bacterium]
ALAHTPEQLPVLAAAGVVDSGGSGFVLLLDAFLFVADARPLPDPPETPAGEQRADTPAGVAAQAEATSGSGLRYEVMYLLEAADDTIGSFRQVWAGVGDSIVVVGGDGLYNCHIHTDDIGAAIDAALDVGRPRQIRVSDLWDQVEEERGVREAAGAEQPVGTIEPVACAVVAVCTGDGIRRIFHSLGVSQTVTGGQSMNPSTLELLEAIGAAPAPEVVLLPNNKNIVPVAQAAAELSTMVVTVVPPGGIPVGFAARLDYAPEADAATNAEVMAATASRVVAGEVTRAVRSSSSDAGPIAEGDYLGLTRAGIRVVASTVAEAATALLAALIDDDHCEIATVIAGEDATAGDTRRITEWLDAEHPGMVAEVHQGGQPLYPYLFSIE